MNKEHTLPTAAVPNIGLFNDSFPPIMDGVTLTVENYVSGLLQRGLNTCVVTPWNPVCVNTEYPVIKYLSLPIHSRKPYRYGYPKLDPFIWRRLRSTPFSLVHAHCPFSSGRLAVYVKRKQHVPLIGTFHSKYKSDLQHSFKNMPWMVSLIMRKIITFFNACDEVWIPQAKVEETVREYGYKGELVVMNNGSDMGQDGDISMLKREARNALGLRDNEMVLLFVGQHIREKGIFVILDALRELNPERTPFQMNFIGNGYALDELKKKVAEYGLTDRVQIHGVIQNRDVLKRYYAASDLFLFPSFYDNAPLVVREAAALETPSILLAGSTASEVITDGCNGFLAERTPAAYSSLIRKLHGDNERLRRVGHEARFTLVKNWNEVMDEVLDRYTMLMRRHKS